VSEKGIRHYQLLLVFLYSLFIMQGVICHENLWKISSRFSLFSVNFYGSYSMKWLSAVKINVKKYHYLL